MTTRKPGQTRSTKGPPKAKPVRAGDSHETLPAVDPYYDWAVTTDFRYFPDGKKTWFPLLLELSGITALQFATSSWTNSASVSKWLRISDLQRVPTPGISSTNFCSVWVRAPFFSALERESRLSVIKRFEFGLPCRAFVSESHRPLLPDRPSALRRKGVPPPVLIGVIDSGIAFVHERFRAPAAGGAPTTRIEYFWGQDFGPGEWGNPGPNVPPFLGSCGWQFSKADLDTALAQTLYAGSVDEDELYRRAGLGYDNNRHKALGMRVAHGTHVMDLACGEDMAAGVASGFPIVAVNLPDVVVEDTSGASLAPYVEEAVKYILAKATQLGTAWGTGPLATVINMSWGKMSDPHDGTSVVEMAIDAQITAWRAAGNKVSVVIPAGNSHLGRCHASMMVRPTKTKVAVAKARDRIDWRVLPDDRTQSFVEIWLPRTAAPGQIEVGVIAPDGLASPWVVEGGPSWPVPAPGSTPLWQVSFPGIPNALGSRSMAIVCVAPTATVDPIEQVAPHGVWTIAFRNRGPALQEPIELWIRRDDSTVGYPIKGRQSRFEDPRYLRFGAFGLPEVNDSPASLVVRAKTSNGLATGHQTVVIGGFRDQDLAMASYSARGPGIASKAGVPAPRTGPDAAAPSEHSVARGGILAAGTRSGSTVAMNGTSVAAPQIARWMAASIAGGYATGVRNDVTTEAGNQDKSPPRLPAPPMAPVPPQDWGGAGRIRLAEASAVVVSLPRANALR